MKIYKFYADWCAPCKTLTSFLEEYNDLPIEAVNIETDEDLVNKYNVKRVPTLVFVDDNGREFNRVTGIVTGEQVKKIMADGSKGNN